jgi:hypothetical protein
VTSNDPYRPMPKPPAGPVKCSECAFGLETPRRDCLAVGEEARLRSLVVVHRRWKADSPDGCEDFMPLADLEEITRFAFERGNKQAIAEIADLRRRRGSA